MPEQFARNLLPTSYRPRIFASVSFGGGKKAPSALMSRTSRMSTMSTVIYDVYDDLSAASTVALTDHVKVVSHYNNSIQFNNNNNTDSVQCAKISLYRTEIMTWVIWHTHCSRMT
jgi:hypothetical protein